MAQAYTSTQLVADIKRRASIPASQSLFTDDDIIDFMDEELHSNLVPFIMSHREEYFVVSEDVAIVAGQSAYPIPSRSVGTKLRDVVLVLTNGELYNMARWTPEMISGRVRQTTYDRSSAFYLQGNDVILWPTPSSPAVMRLSYFRRPGHLVDVKQGGQIKTIDAPNNEITLQSAYPTEWAVNDTVDATNPKPPFSTVVDDLVIVSKPSTVTLELDDVSKLSIGDWITFERESVIPTIPEEGFNVLKQLAIVKIYEALGSTDEMKAAQAKYIEVLKHFQTIIGDRVEGEAKKVVGTSSIADYTRRYRRSGQSFF